MGWFRNRRRNQLKEQLIAEGRLQQYKQRFDVQMRNLDDKMKNLKKQIKEAYERKDEFDTRLKIHQIEEVKTIQQNLRKLLATLEKADLTKASQETYQHFITQLEQFRQAFQEGNKTRRKEKRKFKKYRKESSTVADHLEWIDKKVVQMDKSLDRKDNMTDKALSKIDIDSYVKEL